jgi:prevent-host-death family protein
MKTYTITESKTRLSALVQEVYTTGTPVTIGRAGRPMVQLVPYTPAVPKRQLGMFRGKAKIADDYGTWPPDIARTLGMID